MSRRLKSLYILHEIRDNVRMSASSRGGRFLWEAKKLCAAVRGDVNATSKGEEARVNNAAEREHTSRETRRVVYRQLGADPHSQRLDLAQFEAASCCFHAADLLFQRTHQHPCSNISYKKGKRMIERRAQKKQNTKSMTVRFLLAQYCHCRRREGWRRSGASAL